MNIHLRKFSYISILSKLRRNTADIQGIWMDYHDKILFL